MRATYTAETPLEKLTRIISRLSEWQMDRLAYHIEEHLNRDENERSPSDRTTRFPRIVRPRGGAA